jgi:hypothetical protein
LALLVVIGCAWVGGCGRLHPKSSKEIVYVSQEHAFLRDRVAPVSNHTGNLNNGDKLEVLEHGHRFIRVRDEHGEEGWIEERYTVPAAVFDQFTALAQQHANDAPVATGVLRDQVYLHLAPGRDTQHLYLLPENDKLQLLQRASTARPIAQEALPPRGAATNGKPMVPPHGPPPLPGAPAVPMEDWWLVRDEHHHTGWILGRRFDVDIPEAISGYSEGQKFVGAYVLGTIDDPDSATPDHKVPIYVTVLNAFKEGLPYDYNQVRVFTWNVKKHRYETAYREHGLWGFLPVSMINQVFENEGSEPTFTLHLDKTESASINAETGAIQHGPLTPETYRLVDSIVVKKVVVQAGGEPNANAANAKKKSAPARRRH